MSPRATVRNELNPELELNDRHFETLCKKELNHNKTIKIFLVFTNHRRHSLNVLIIINRIVRHIINFINVNRFVVKFRDLKLTELVKLGKGNLSLIY